MYYYIFILSIVSAYITERQKLVFSLPSFFLTILFGSLTFTYLHISNNLAQWIINKLAIEIFYIDYMIFFQVEWRVNWVPVGKKKTTVCQSTILVKLDQIDKKIAIVRKSYIGHQVFFLSFFLSVRMNSFKVVLTLVKSIQVSQITCGFFLLLHSLKYDFTYRFFLLLNHHL